MSAALSWLGIRESCWRHSVKGFTHSLVHVSHLYDWLDHRIQATLEVGWHWKYGYHGYITEPVSGNGPPEWRRLRDEWVGFAGRQARGWRVTETRQLGKSEGRCAVRRQFLQINTLSAASLIAVVRVVTQHRLRLVVFMQARCPPALSLPR
jgi:hypothetical protein